MFGIKKKLKLDVQISHNWRFRAEGEENLVVALFSGWLGELTASHDELPAPKEKPPVGFASTRSLAAETALVDEDFPDVEDDDED